MQSSSFREPELKDRVLLTVILLAVVLIIALGGFFLLEKIGTFFYLILNIFIEIALLILWHSNMRAYRPKNCGFEFEISFFQDLKTAISFSQKMLTCPSLNLKDYSSELIRKKTK